MDQSPLPTDHSRTILICQSSTRPLASSLRGAMTKRKGIVMSGIRPAGFLHLGNYFGAIRNYVRMQEEYECFFMVADLHSLTTHPDTQDLKANVHRVLAENLACGLDSEKVALYCQ